jgi:hypothetical protein
MPNIAIKNRDFNAVIPRRLQLSEDGIVLGTDVRSPKEEIEAVFHELALPRKTMVEHLILWF